MLVGQLHGIGAWPPFALKGHPRAPPDGRQHRAVQQLGDGIAATYDADGASSAARSRTAVATVRRRRHLPVRPGRGGELPQQCLGTVLVQQDGRNLSGAVDTLQDATTTPTTRSAVSSWSRLRRRRRPPRPRGTCASSSSTTSRRRTTTVGALGGAPTTAARPSTFVKLTGHSGGGRGVEKVTVPLGETARRVEFATDAAGRRAFGAASPRTTASASSRGLLRPRALPRLRLRVHVGGGARVRQPGVRVVHDAGDGPHRRFASRAADYALPFLSDCSWTLNHSWRPQSELLNFTRSGPTRAELDQAPTPSAPPRAPPSPTRRPSSRQSLPLWGRDCPPLARPSSPPACPTNCWASASFPDFDLEPTSAFGFTDRIEIYVGDGNGEELAEFAQQPTLRNNLSRCAVGQVRRGLPAKRRLPLREQHVCCVLRLKDATTGCACGLSPTATTRGGATNRRPVAVEAAATPSGRPRRTCKRARGVTGDFLQRRGRTAEPGVLVRLQPRPPALRAVLPVQPPTGGVSRAAGTFANGAGVRFG